MGYPVLNFDFNEISSATFGIGTRTRAETDFYSVPVDSGVGDKLRAMARNTVEKMEFLSTDPNPYEPSNVSTGQQHITIPLDNPLVELFKDVYDMHSPQTGGGAILRNNPRRVFCYFARFVDTQQQRLMGMHMPNKFREVLAQRERFMFLAGDELRAVGDDALFRLDMDFDLLVDSQEVRILRPSGFEIIGRLQERIKAAAITNAETMGNQIPFLNVDSISNVAGNNVQVARLLASVATNSFDGMTIDSLKLACDEQQVTLVEGDGQVTVDDENVVSFLRVLNRRRLSIMLIPGKREVYDASVRTLAL